MQMNSLIHSMLYFFGKVPILDPFLCSNRQILPKNFLNESTIEFQLETDRNIFADLRSTRLFIRGRVINWDGTRLDNAEETLLVNNALHSLFFNLEVCLNNEQVHRPILFMLIKLLSLLNFQGQKERRKPISMSKDIVTKLNQLIFTKDHF